MSILQLLTQLLKNNQQSSPQATSQPPNPSVSSYPPEAFTQSPQSQSQQNPLSSLLGQQNSDGNMLGLLSSLLGKGDNPLSSILGGIKKEEEKPSSPKSELLL